MLGTHVLITQCLLGEEGKSWECDVGMTGRTHVRGSEKAER